MLEKFHNDILNEESILPEINDVLEVRQIVQRAEEMHGPNEEQLEQRLEDVHGINWEEDLIEMLRNTNNRRTTNT